MLYVSHRLSEILDLCQRVTVFRDGWSVQEFARENLTRHALVEAIVGGRPPEEPPVRRQTRGEKGGPQRLKVLTRLPRVRGVSFQLHEGEVLGLGGLIGAGRTELMRLVYGADLPDGGRMMLNGVRFAPRTPA